MLQDQKDAVLGAAESVVSAAILKKNYLLESYAKGASAPNSMQKVEYFIECFVLSIMNCTSLHNSSCHLITILTIGSLGL